MVKAPRLEAHVRIKRVAFRRLYGAMVRKGAWEMLDGASWNNIFRPLDFLSEAVEWIVYEKYTS